MIQMAQPRVQSGYHAIKINHMIWDTFRPRWKQQLCMLREQLNIHIFFLLHWRFICQLNSLLSSSLVLILVGTINCFLVHKCQDLFHNPKDRTPPYMGENSKTLIAHYCILWEHIIQRRFFTFLLLNSKHRHVHVLVLFSPR